MLPAKWLSVNRVSRFGRKRMQKVDFPDPLGSLIMHVNGAFNLSSSVIQKRLMFTPADVTTA
jgi:hypothetical protein